MWLKLYKSFGRWKSHGEPPWRVDLQFFMNQSHLRSPRMFAMLPFLGEVALEVFSHVLPKPRQSAVPPRLHLWILCSMNILPGNYVGDNFRCQHSFMLWVHESSMLYMSACVYVIIMYMYMNSSCNYMQIQVFYQIAGEQVVNADLRVSSKKVRNL